uniref:TGF-beta family profile domain-containing protein n=1 Tax=Timema monikensis TaxID=170555 RepID=A0A7R9HHZ4_9NEOP|nr:unnamed protein product [Timema monikensis]
MYFDSNVAIDWLILLLLIATPLRCDGLQRFADSQEQEGLVEQEDDLTTHWLEDQQMPQRISSREKNNREKALAKLQEVFGLPDRASKHHHQVPPQFMTELYNTIAEPNGLTRGRNPYNAKVVRSFIERDSSKPQFFFFNISGLDETEKVLEAELHLYRMRSSIKEKASTSPYYLVGEKITWGPPLAEKSTVHVYQVLEGQPLAVTDAHRLLNVHYVSAHDGPGWQVFNVREAVLDWVGDARPNLGLLVRATTLFGESAHEHYARRDHHHNSKQPILVLFNDDGKSTPSVPTQVLEGNPKTNQYENSLDTSFEEYSDIPRDKRSIPLSSPHRYHRRSHVDDSSNSNSTRNGTRITTSPGKVNSTECSRENLYVDFSDIGWNSWIISPLGYNAYHCKGECNLPLEPSQLPTNHATVQSIVHEMGLAPGVGKPCCVPTSLASITFLYFDDDDNVILKTYEDMVADICGCH